MNTTLLRRVRRHFCSDLVPREVNRRNQRAWVKAVRNLGHKWVLHRSRPSVDWRAK